ncbi:MAG: hypothetical protein CM15mV25_1120 [uncultured marine virus]|nr:MAG: hypothetical protein CM15mV25_1120 [uncultured marine virus]
MIYDVKKNYKVRRVILWRQGIIQRNAKLTKHYLGCYDNDKMVGVISFGWGTRPKHTIQKLFPKLDTKDYFEIGKMCMDDKMPRNSESQLLKLHKMVKRKYCN